MWEMYVGVSISKGALNVMLRSSIFTCKQQGAINSNIMSGSHSANSKCLLLCLVVRVTEKPELWSLSSVMLASSCENEIYKSEVLPLNIRCKVCRPK